MRYYLLFSFYELPDLNLVCFAAFFCNITTEDKAEIE